MKIYPTEDLYQSQDCNYPNVVSDEVVPHIQSMLPDSGSIREKVLDHTTKVPTFLSTLSADLCDDGRMGNQTRDAAVGFITRSGTSGAVLTGMTTLAGIGLAVAGSPLIAIGVGAVGLLVLPPLVEGVVNRVGGVIGGLFNRVTNREES